MANTAKVTATTAKVTTTATTAKVTATPATAEVTARAKVKVTTSTATATSKATSEGAGGATGVGGGSGGATGGKTAKSGAGAGFLGKGGAGLVAYVRGGEIFVSTSSAETRLTSGGGWSRPRFSPDGKSIAALRAGQLWTMKADGSGKRRITTRAAAGPSWSPDGKSIAFASLSCSGGPGVYKIAATVVDAAPEVLFPAYCREEELPAEPAAQAAGAGPLSERLRTDDAVAWSPDGTRVAFRGGDCESTYDACLTVGTVATGGEKTVAAYGGGSRQNSGFAVVPSWRADGAKLAWTAYEKGETMDRPVHVIEYDTVSGAKRTVGADQDRELAYIDAGRAVATGTYRNGSWVMLVDLASGARTAFRQGSQPSVQPLR